MPNVGKPHDNQASGPPRARRRDEPLVDDRKIEGSMHTEEPTGWDQAPHDITDPRRKRHPRPDGKGGIIPADEPGDGIIEKRE